MKGRHRYLSKTFRLLLNSMVSAVAHSAFACMGLLLGAMPCLACEKLTDVEELIVIKYVLGADLQSFSPLLKVRSTMVAVKIRVIKNIQPKCGHLSISVSHRNQTQRGKSCIL